MHLLLLTDFSYKAKGRDYYREDVEISVLLRKRFNVLISHIDDCEAYLDQVDVVMLRNTGPQATHALSLSRLRTRNDLLLFNDLKGKGDINGKTHLLELFGSGYPVIPTFETSAQAFANKKCDRYILKPLNGADSLGVQIVSAQDLAQQAVQGLLIQPLLDFEYEASFYFVNDRYHYALYAPCKEKRWELAPYHASEEDIAFAKSFVVWNTCKVGIQRVDACRLKTGELLLMELEDYNPFLSLDLLASDVKQEFLISVVDSLTDLVHVAKSRPK